MLAQSLRDRFRTQTSTTVISLWQMTLAALPMVNRTQPDEHFLQLVAGQARRLGICDSDSLNSMLSKVVWDKSTLGSKVESLWRLVSSCQVW